jgi:hypothetical protein
VPGPIASGGVPGPIATGGVPRPIATGGVPGPIATGGVPGPIATGGVPGPIASGGVPGPILQIACAETLEAESVAAFAAETFRSPIAPVRTSNTRATTVRHLYIRPPEGKLTRRGVYVVLFPNGTEMLPCV